MVSGSAIMVAVSPRGVIGKGGGIPWRYRGDLQRLKQLTLGKTVVMGRLTWESIGRRPLSGRRNVVVSRRSFVGVETFPSLPLALAACDGFVWFLGGAKVYAEAMSVCDYIDVTYVPDDVDPEGAVLFPPIDAATFEPGPMLAHELEPALVRRVYRRRGTTVPSP